MFTLIRFTQVNRKMRTARPCWLETAKFTDGPGMKVKSMTVTTDRSKAMRFSSVENAHAVAVQFSHTPASLETALGVALVAETEKLHAEQLMRYADYQRMREEFNEALREAVSHSDINLLRL